MSSLATAQVPPPASALRELAWSAQGDSLLFTGTHQGKPVNMIRTGLPGKGFWSIYTGTLSDRVRLTYRDGRGLVDVLALDKGYRITLNTVGEERTEYRLYGPNRAFIVGSVLYRGDGRRWMQGIMKTEAFPGYSSLTHVSDVSEQITTALRQNGRTFALRMPRWPGLGLIGSAQAATMDDLVNGFFSASAADAREFFRVPGNVMVTAGGLGLAAFTVKLLGQSELVVGVAGAGTVVGLAPVLVAMGTGVAIGMAAGDIVNWAESKNITGKMGDLFGRLTRKTSYSESPPPMSPMVTADAQPPGSRTTAPSVDSKAETEQFKQMLALTEQLDRMDQVDFDDAMQAAEACRRSGNFECADRNHDKAVKFSMKARNRERLAQARQQVVADRRAAEEARRREEQRQLALAEQRRREQAEEEEAERQRVAAAQARESGGGDLFGRALFSVIGAGIVGSARGVLTEDKVLIATGLVQDIMTGGNGENIRRAEADIRAGRAASASASGAGRLAGGAVGSGVGSGGNGGATSGPASWHEDYTITENDSGRVKRQPNYQTSIPGDVMMSSMGSRGAAQSFYSNGTVTAYSGCGACGVGSSITVVVRYSAVTDTHVFTRDR